MLRTSPGEQRWTAHTTASAEWWFALGLVLVELVAAVAGFSSLPLAGAALIAPGFAFVGLLPAPLRDAPVGRLTAPPVLGLAVTALALISITRLGVPLTPITVHLVLAVLLAVGWLVGEPRAGDAPMTTGATATPASAAQAEGASPTRGTLARRRRETLVSLSLDAVGLVLVIALALVLDWRVVGQLPVPGDDWAKYLLYADEIRHQGHLLLDNRLWMGGRPFSEDPGVPSLEGAALLMTGAPAGGLVRTIIVLQVLTLIAVFGTARVWFGRTGAVVAGALLAVVPASQNILGWHGLANIGALALMALVLAQLGAWLVGGGLDRRAEVGLAITLVGVAAFHKFTALFLAGTLVLLLVAAVVFGPRRALLLSAGRTALIGAIGGLPVVFDLRQRASEAGGTLPYTSYLGTKVDLGLAIRDLTVVSIGAAVLTVVLLGARGRFPRPAWPPLAMALVATGLGFGYLAHVPLYYSRVTFFLPMPLALLAGAGAGALATWFTRRWGLAHGPLPVAFGGSATRAPRGPARAGAGQVQRAIVGAAVVAGLCGAVLGGMAVRSWRQAEQVRLYYAFATPQALTALDDLATRLAPNEIVATDRCWSFLATWLLHTRTYPALEEQDIQPKAELLVARKAAAILHGTAEGRELMRSLPVRYAVLDPNCPVNGYRFFPPGEPEYAGSRLAIVKLNPSQKNPKAPDRPHAKSKRSTKPSTR